MAGCTAKGCSRVFDTERGMRIHRGVAHPQALPHNDPEKLEQLYVEDELDREIVAEELDCGEATISNRLEEFNINRPHNDPEILSEMYVERGLCQYEIADELGCRERTVWDNLHRLGIERD